MLGGGDDHTLPSARVDVDVRVDAALADQPQVGQAFEQWRPNLGALPDQDQDLSLSQPFGEHVHVLNVVVPDSDLVPIELLKAGESAQRVEVVVQDGDVHGTRRQGMSRLTVSGEKAGTQTDT